MNVTGIVKVSHLESRLGHIKARVQENKDNRTIGYHAKFETDKAKVLCSGSKIKIKNAQLDKTVSNNVCIVIKEFDLI